MILDGSMTEEEILPLIAESWALAAPKEKGRKQADHLKRARFSRDLDHENWREGNGRKKGSVVYPEDSRCAQIVKRWREENAGSTNKSLCSRETGLTRPTVRKWWNAFE